MDSKKMFLQWLAINEPVIFKAAAERAESPGLSGIADFFTSAVDVIKQAAPAITQYKAQSKILKVQLERAKQGLPPLDTADYAPTIKVQPQLTPETNYAIQQGLTSGVSGGLGGIGKYLPFVLLGVGALFLLKRARG